MKNKNNMFIKALSSLIIVFALTFSMGLNAQGPPTGPTDPSTDAIPLDGGLAILLAGAAAFGIKKLRAKKE